MKKKDVLGQFEMLVMTAVLQCKKEAYGMAVHEKVEELGSRTVKLPSVYVVLDRLEEKGYVKSWLANSTPERGNKRSRYFELTGEGDKVLAESAATSVRLMESWSVMGWLKKWKVKEKVKAPAKV